jgi:hypothetical protein
MRKSQGLPHRSRRDFSGCSAASASSAAAMTVAAHAIPRIALHSRVLAFIQNHLF